MQVNNNPDIDFPAARSSASASPARRRPRWKPSHAAGRSGGPRRQRRRRDQLARSAKATATPSSSSRSARRSTARSTTSATPIAQIRGNLPDGILEPQVKRVDIAGGPIVFVACRNDRHDARAAELVRRQYRRQAAARRRGHGRRHRATAASTARSASSSIRPRCRRRASPPRRSTSSCARRNINAAGGRAEIAGSEQSVRVLGNAHDAYRPRRRPRSRFRGGRIVRLADIADGQGRLFGAAHASPSMNGRQVISFNVQRAKGASDVTVYDEALEGAAQDREGRSRRSTSPRSTTASIIPRTSTQSAMEGLVEGAVLAVLVVFLFLRDIRATADLGAGHPAVGDPGLLVHEPAGHHAERPVAAGAEPGRGRAGRRRDRRDREHRPAHAHGQDPPTRRRSTPPTRSASRCSRRPCRSSRCSCRSALMPGISGQFFKAFGFTVVVSVLMSLARRAHDHAADRGLFPARQGHQPHASARRWTISRPAQLDRSIPSRRMPTRCATRLRGKVKRFAATTGWHGRRGPRRASSSASCCSRRCR